MQPATPKTERPPPSQLRKVRFRGSLQNILRVLAAALLIVSVMGTAHGQLAIPGSNLGVNGIVLAVESLASGKVVLGGAFNSFNGDDSSGQGLIRLTSSATKDPVWDIGYVNKVVDTLVVGDFLYVAGEFTTVRTLSAGTLARSYLFRMNLTGPDDGKLDTTWIPNVNAPVYRLETDGTNLFIAGYFTMVNGTTRDGLAKITLTAPGTVDESWDPSPNGSVSDLKFANSQLYVCGLFGNIGGVTNNYIARLTPGGTGAADSLWKPICDRPVTSLESDATYIYLGGKFSVVNNAFNNPVTRRVLCRFSTSTGSAALDGTWDPDCDGEVGRMLKSGTALFISGVFQKVGGQPRFFLAKVPDTGTGFVDASFLPNPAGAVFDMKISGGSLLCGGRFSTTVGAASGAFGLLNTTNGSASPEFTGTISSQGNAYCMVPLDGGKMMIGGVFDTVNGVGRKGIARLNSDGSLDPSFQADLFGYNPNVKDMKVDGTFVYIAGDFFKAGGVVLHHVARINLTNSVVDAAWNPEPFTPLRCLETDGSYVYVGGGGLRDIDAVHVFNVARISKATHAVDSTWRPVIGGYPNGDPALGAVEDMVFDGSDLIIGGEFAFIINPFNSGDYYQRVRLAKLTTTAWGQPVAGWSTIFYDTVKLLVLLNRNLYVGGNFVGVNGYSQYFVAKINPADGSWDSSFFTAPVSSGDAYGGDNVSALATDGNYLYIGGNYERVWNGTAFVPSPYLTRVNLTNGIYDSTWNPYPEGPVNAMAFQGNDLWVWGLYRGMAGQAMQDVVVLRPNGTAYQTWVNTFFTPAQRTNADYMAPSRDPDGDGIANCVEFQFNMDPLSSVVQHQVADIGTAGLPLIRKENVSGHNYLTEEFTQWKATSGASVAYVPQFTSELSSGFAPRGVLMSTASLDANRERVKYRDSVSDLPAAFGSGMVRPLKP